MRAELRHYQSGHVIYSEKGFSWTTLFFGFFVPLFRGDLKWFAVMLITNVLITIVTAGFGLIISWFAFACIYNGSYIKDLGKKGYVEVPYNREKRLEHIQHNLKQ
ncbi:DUF2628 domain-containing protein [Paenibacillus sp. N4]|uniref:DUF2628 domain-containing protein n=1 Tax=Paenibacillus vietnamensis TaxID=2590547 RepID=UPI001CD053C7|nr:DUF2628 domain-containing protein [Paenibacillus vietnamensis]MCA0754892.1 DUF2628 domain-containing protein [Paenibacillus vietnamensis]